MKKAIIITLSLALFFSICVTAFAEIYAVEHDGQITYYESKEAALASYTGQGSIWSTTVRKNDVVYSPEDDFSGTEEHDFWLGVKEEIDASASNMTLDVYCYGYQNMSVSVMEALYRHPTISLAIYSDFGDFIIPSGYLVEIEDGRITYPVYQLFLLYSDMSNWEVPKSQKTNTTGPEKIDTYEKTIAEVAKEEKVKELEIKEETKAEEIQMLEQEEISQPQKSNVVYLIIIALLSLLIIILIVVIIKSKNSKEKMIIL